MDQTVCRTHVVVAQHGSFGVSSGSRGVDEGAALVGLQAVNHSVELLVWDFLSQRQELCPLQQHRHSVNQPV